MQKQIKLQLSAPSLPYLQLRMPQLKLPDSAESTKQIKRSLHHLKHFLILCLTTAWLAGCATPGTGFPPADDQNLASINDPTARRLLLNGNAIGASDRYSQLADAANDPLLKLEYRIIAAEILFDRGVADQGRLKLTEIPRQLPDPAIQQRRDILVAKGELIDGNAEQALIALPDPATISSNLHRARVYEVRAQSFRLLGNPDGELAARIDLESEVRRPAIIQANHEQIWQMLTTLPVSRLREMTTNVRGEIYQGWIELALANTAPAGSANSEQQRLAGLQNWRSRYPNHPATRTLGGNLFGSGGGSFDGLNLASGPIRQVGVLLPLSAPGIGVAAEAIKDGIVLAYQNEADRSALPAIRFYDIGDNINFVRTAFQNALNDGADAIIGPLRKEAVTAIITQRHLPVPVLTLNQVDSFGGVAPQNVIQFGLAPEDEARSAAERALATDHRSAIVLQSDDSRGDRAARAFTETMLQNGGDVVHTAILPSDKYDYSKELKDALLITQSDQRFRNLSRALDTKLFFEPGIRGDVDMVFLAINNEQARSVRPQLAFFHAGRLPMLGTSRISAIDDDIKANRDLNGIAFADTPWALDKNVQSSSLYRQVRQSNADTIDVFGKLYALGMDAWTLINNLDTLSNDSRAELNGFTGKLSLTADGRIRRQLLWAQYIDGKSVPLKPVVFDPSSYTINNLE